MRELVFSVTAAATDESEAARLVRLARGGDRAAFERLVLLEQRPVVMTAYRLLGNYADAQDAAQQVFLKLHRHLHSVREETVEAWLYRVTVNVCRDHYRAGGAASELPEVVSAAPGPEEALHADERRRLLHEALWRLTPRERSAIVLREIEGLDTGQVAGILGVTAATVRSQVRAARIRLRQILDTRRVK